MSKRARISMPIRWNGPGIQRDLLVKLYDGGAGITGTVANPGASARDVS